MPPFLSTDFAGSVAAEAALCGFLAFFIFMCLAGAEAPSAAIGAEAWAKETAAKEESRAATMKVLVISDSSSDEIRFGSDSLERARQAPDLDTQRRSAAGG